MATGKRPGAVTAMAVLNFVLGGLGIAGFLCVSALVAIFASIWAKWPAPPPGQPDLKALVAAVDKADPNIKYYFVIVGSLGFVLDVVQVVSGVGLLRMRYWGRSWSICYALVTICMTLVGTVYSFAVVNPAMEQAGQAVQANDAGKAGPGAAPPAANPFAGNPVGNVGGSVIGLATGVAYPAILLYIMLLPRIRKAFAVANGDAAPEDDEPEDYRDRRDDLDRDLARDGGPPEGSDGPDDTRFRAPPE